MNTQRKIYTTLDRDDFKNGAFVTSLGMEVIVTGNYVPADKSVGLSETIEDLEVNTVGASSLSLMAALTDKCKQRLEDMLLVEEV